MSGAVHNPGVFELPAGSRIQDAISAAGGVLPAGDSGGLNLAARITDGMQIHVGEVATASEGALSPGTESALSTDSVSGTESTPAGTSVNLNTASQAELETLSGIGPSTAEKIISYRESNGPFAAIEDIQNISGIGPATFEKIKDTITVKNE